MWRSHRAVNLLARECHTALQQRGAASAAASRHVNKDKDRYTVVLKKDVEDIGRQGDVVKVRHGYARNRLIPSRLAVPGTKKNIELYGTQTQDAAEQEEETPAEDALAALEREVQAVLKRLAASVIELKRAVVTKERDGRAQPTAELAQAVTRADVAEALQKQKGVDVVEQLLFMDPIKEVGEFDVPLRMLHPDGTPPTFRLKIVPFNPAS